MYEQILRYYIYRFVAKVYAKIPTRWLVDDLIHRNRWRACAAHRELARRAKEDSIERQLATRILELVLRDARRPLPSCLREDDKIRYLLLASPRALTDARHEQAYWAWRAIRDYQNEMAYWFLTRGLIDTRLYQQWCDEQMHVSLIARPRALLSEGIPVDLVLASRMPNASPGPFLSVFRYDPEKPPPERISEPAPPTYIPKEGRLRISEERANPFRTLRRSWVIDVEKAGKYRMGFLVEVPMLEGPGPRDELFRFRRHFIVQSEVLAQEPPDFVKLIEDPTLESSVRSSIRLEKGLYSDGKVDISVGAEPPVPVCFAVSLEIPGQELQKTWIRSASSGEVSVFTSFMLPGAPPKPFSIRFDPAPEIARRTPDLTEIWGKPIEFTNLTLGSLPNKWQPPSPPW